MKLRHKYRAKPTTINGRRYDSKREAAYAVELEHRKAAGEILGWLEQVPIRFRSGTRYVCDFQIFEADGTVRFVEVKGMETPQWKIKRRLLLDEYPWLEVEVVR